MRPELINLPVEEFGIEVPKQLGREGVSSIGNLVGAYLGTLAATVRASRDMGFAMTFSHAEMNLFDAMIGERLDPLPTQQVRIGPYSADFYFEDEAVAVEVDGKHHEQRRERDAVRDRYFIEQQICVLRISASAVWHDPYACVDAIRAALELAPKLPVGEARLWGYGGRSYGGRTTGR